MTWGQGSPAGWRKARKHTLERDHYECQLHYDVCIGYATEVDHITNLAAQGQSRDTTTHDDLQAVCKPCHQVKTSIEAAAGRRRHRTTWRREPERHPGLR